MRMSHYIVALLLCGLTLSAMAQETTESLIKRVRELEKANLVLQEDLARTQLALDNTRTQLKTVTRSLDEEIAARKALADALNAANAVQRDLASKLDDLNNKLSGVTGNQQTHAASLDGLNKKVAMLEKGLADQAERHNKDITDLRTGLTTALNKVRDDFLAELASFKDLVEQKFAALRGDLDKERQERIAADESADKARVKIVDQQKKDRTITYVMGVVLGGLSAAK